MQISHGSLLKRLHQDIADLRRNPYPNIYLHFEDTDITKACLVLTPEDDDPLHLRIEFPSDYPLRAPRVTIQSAIVHPNVFGDYICATILNTTESWTPAYTLKGIVIQLLSFFCSEEVEQNYGGRAVNLAEYRSSIATSRYARTIYRDVRRHECKTCGFGVKWEAPHSSHTEQNAESRVNLLSQLTCNSARAQPGILRLPDEVLMEVLSEIDTTDISALTDAIPTVKNVVTSYDLIRIRELQCFCLKASFMEAKLGIGVSVTAGRKPILRSEFDLLSQEAFFQHNVQRSIQGVPFDKWLPLPLNRRHWSLVRTTTSACLSAIYHRARMTTDYPQHVDVLEHFMNTVVVQFSADTERGFNFADSKSTLNHASEKAVEAYFSLFHLLLCLATENPEIVTAANRKIARFLKGPRSKTHFPDLGHVLVASLISDHGLTEDFTLLIIKEAILRNVVWMLDVKGTGMAELAYLEPSALSAYRLAMTYRASLTSYRLLMFLKLFSTAARPAGKSLVELRDALFDAHGAPPAGTASKMAAAIRHIHAITTFPAFLTTMGIKQIPGQRQFTSFLRRTITDSVAAGYSRMPLSQSQLYMIRKVREKGVQSKEGVRVTPELERWWARGEKWANNGWKGRPSFFPERR